MIDKARSEILPKNFELQKRVRGRVVKMYLGCRTFTDLEVAGKKRLGAGFLARFFGGGAALGVVEDTSTDASTRFDVEDS